MNPILFPPAVCHAIQALEQAGFCAYAVGGCVRDSLLGRPPQDWDLATSARPEQVRACFAGRRMIETGVQHGTLTVVLEDMPLEVTTFRGESAYRDHRHPDSVTFGTCLEEDLARRDFTINAMACRPAGPVIDPFGGQEDLKTKSLRCVGEPSRRFEEDALRIMRALRFAAALGFLLEEKTALALKNQAGLLRYVAAERLARELDGLLAGVLAPQVIWAYKEVMELLLPEIHPLLQEARWDQVARALAAQGDHIQKLGALLAWLGEPSCRAALTRLRYDRSTIENVCLLAREVSSVPPPSPPEVLRLLHRAGAENARRLAALWGAPGEAVGRLLQELLQCGACYSLRQLAVTGADLAGLGAPPGPGMGALLRRLLEQVMDGALPNEKKALLAAAAVFIKPEKAENG